MRASLVLLSAVTALAHNAQQIKNANPLDDSENSIASLKKQIAEDPFVMPQMDFPVLATLKTEPAVATADDDVFGVRDTQVEYAVEADGSISSPNPLVALSGMEEIHTMPKAHPAALTEATLQSHVETVTVSDVTSSSWLGQFGYARGWVELLASEGGAFTKMHDIPVESRALFTLTIVTAVLSFFALWGLCWWVSKRTGSALARGSRTVGELCGLTAFRFYSGLLMCTWLPFLLAEEGGMLWPDHQSLFMGVGKLILAAAMIACPVFGLLNDRTLHAWGRRRAWFMGGVGLILFGVCVCAFASASRHANLYLFGTVLWCVGESIAESTTEALVPDLCIEEDYNKAASVRGVMFMAGGLVGYGLIILSSMLEWNPAVFYVYYLVFILAGAPWSIYYACPSDAEKRALERRNDPSMANEPLVGSQEQVPGDAAAADAIDDDEGGKSIWKQCYVDCYYASNEFRYVSLATVFFSMSTAGMMFVILILRDLVGIADDATAQLHMACASIVMTVSAAIASVVMGLVDAGAQNRTLFFGIFLVMYLITEISVPFCYFVSDTPHDKLVYLYGISAIKGFAFGGIYNIMQPITWEAIPDSWKSGTGSVSRATAWMSVCRSFGVGAGNFACGMILECARDFYTPAGQEMSKSVYPIQGYFALFSFTSCMLIVTSVVLGWSTASKNRRSFLEPGNCSAGGLGRDIMAAPPAGESAQI